MSIKQQLLIQFCTMATGHDFREPVDPVIEASGSTRAPDPVKSPVSQPKDF